MQKPKGEQAKKDQQVIMQTNLFIECQFSEKLRGGF